MKPVILAVMAHPDDAEILCFGSLLKYQSLGYQVNVLICTTGEQGISIQDKKNHNITKLPVKMRYEETINAFKNTNIKLSHLNEEDGAIQLNNKLISAIEKQIQLVQPTILITHWITQNGLDHQDHAIIGQACVNVSQRCSSIKMLLQAEPLQQSKCEFVPNYFIEISKQFNEKMKALEQHQSQKGRIYLSPEFHRSRCQNNSLLAGRHYFESKLLFESFYLSHQVEL